MRIYDVRTLRQIPVIGLLALIASGPVHAVDGVIEINQVRVKAGGVTTLDMPFFPVTLSQSGSYRLTGNLDVTDASARPGGMLAENMTAIEVITDDVTIDLNGFMIKGPCLGAPPCSPVGDGRGIRGGNNSGLSVMNGTVRGMGDRGLDFVNNDDSQVESVRALSNGGTGIFATTVVNCIANRNGANGISAVLAVGCTAFDNVGSQITANGIAGHNICGPAFAPCP